MGLTGWVQARLAEAEVDDCNGQMLDLLGRFSP